MQMQGFIANTNFYWYERLSRTAGPKDANFWRPSTRRFNFAIGTPFIFKLKAPYNAIAGFGYFAGFSVMPDWLAWDTFLEANGVDSLDGLKPSLPKSRETIMRAAITGHGGEIGTRDVDEGYEREERERAVG